MLIVGEKINATRKQIAQAIEKRDSRVIIETARAQREAGADYIDIELESEPGFAKPLVQLARKHKCKVIVSHHDEKKTPETKTLWKLVNNCFQKGAHIAKIACMVKTPMDNLKLLRLLEGDKKVVVVGMGKEGVITRITAPTLGAPFTYASWEKGRETAPGQLTYKEMVAIYKRMGVDY